MILETIYNFIGIGTQRMRKFEGTNCISLKYLLIAFPAFLFSLHTNAQKQSWPVRYVKKVFFDTTAKAESQLLIYPIAAYSPETSVEFGVSSLYVRYAQGDTNNRLSEINALAFYTLHNQYGGIIEHALYSDKNVWFSLGKLKFQSFPLTFYGIGAESPNVKLANVDAFQFQIKERGLRKIYGNFYGGVEVDLQHLGNVKFHDYDTSLVYERPLGHEGSTNLGIGLGALYDNRHNVLNVRHGFFSELAFLHYNPSLGSKYEFTSMFGDMRWFHPVRNRNVLAVHAVGQFTSGNPPFNQLALLGGESIMRGYYLGRFRDKNLLATQVEYRMLPLWFARRWGATVFASSGLVYNQLKHIETDHLLVSGGFGARFLLFPKKDVWIRADFAFNNEGGYGIYIFVGEAF